MGPKGSEIEFYLWMMRDSNFTVGQQVIGLLSMVWMVPLLGAALFLWYKMRKQQRLWHRVAALILAGGVIGLSWYLHINLSPRYPSTWIVVPAGLFLLAFSISVWRRDRRETADSSSNGATS